MLRKEDIQILRGRAAHGDDFISLMHVPTGMARSHQGTLALAEQNRMVKSWLAEIEAELKALGLTEYVVSDEGSK